MIVDCFIFFDELDLLELRLKTLGEVVDRFVLCESPYTFRGNPKPLHFAESGKRFASWQHKIVALVCPQMPCGNAWENEVNQRDFLSQALADCRDDDLILLSDVDEIPDPQLVARRPTAKLVLGHRQRVSRGYVNHVATNATWIGTRAFVAGSLFRLGRFQVIRSLPAEELEIVEGGWHFSYLGGAEAVRRKLMSYAHTEYDLPYFTDLRRIQTQFENDPEARFVPVDETFPIPLREEARWSHLIGKSPADGSYDFADHVNGCFAYVPQDAERITALTAEPNRWERIGRERFGSRFVSAATIANASEMQFRPDEWVVVDGWERTDAKARRLLSDPKLGVVAYLRNARSYDCFETVLAGGPFPPGQALGIRELREWAQSNGRAIDVVHRLPTPSVFVPWEHLPQTLTNAKLGEVLSFPSIGRDAFADFLAPAFVATLQPSES
jgi:beta-1,4-mannosyl-glycoprotein beta-1,4-N-acetylglucosaminyltransferase